MEHNLTSEQIEELREAFELFDKNGDGTISATELSQVMKQMNQNPTQQEINDMIGEVDEDGNGTIEFDEFVTMMTRHRNSAKITDEQLQAAFARVDVKNQGAIDGKQLYDCLKLLHVNLTKEGTRLVEQTIRLCENKIDLKNLRMLVVQLPSEEEEDDLVMSFKMFDKNGDGSISREELKEVMKSLGEDLSEKEIDDMLAEADVNNDNVISFEEFRAMMSQTGK
ncbi:hypothetical protein EV183_004949 [Coemansia sp. RSA 2336]|nr:hypothetical protein EV183_004949 [Coemansia sp. RSA 2336]